MATPHDAGPLTGVVVVDCSTVLAGPYATMLLGDLGADVVKVEPPSGDATRGWGPPWVGSEREGTRTAAYFVAVNRNKRSIRVDLRQPDGAEILRRLLATADVLVENSRRDSFARLGFDDASLERLNPRLIHLAISGYGPEGPDADRPGYDFVLQAEAGLMSITGAPDDQGGEPTKVGVAIADIVTGLHGAVGVLAALAGRDRGGSLGGRGQRIDTSILESTLSALVNQAQNAFVDGVPPTRLGNAHPNIVPYETFPTADGAIVVAVGSERQWPRFCEAIGVPDLAPDARFVTNGNRVRNRGLLRDLLEPRLASRPSAHWLDALRAADVPAGAINDVAAAFDTPQARARGMRVEVSHPSLGRVDQVRSPFELSRSDVSVRLPPPMLGEHTNDILGELGYAEADVQRLREAGVV
jgi:crotonobetainyl-CoA:carnitine CoA-transferase CaiB-like acyl-CoA transferase